VTVVAWISVWSCVILHPANPGAAMKKKMPSSYGEKEARAGLKAALPPLETFPSQFPDYEITIEIPEFTSVCPKTGLPDFGVITVRYVPAADCLELKALKSYINGYRNLGIFYENAVNRILEDIVRACRPVRASVSGEFNPRGGIRTVVEAHYPRSSRARR
jgi:7-cyano-7-deazaguanine reductase